MLSPYRQVGLPLALTRLGLITNTQFEQIFSMALTFLSCPPLASSFPSEEKWQQTTLLVLARADEISVNVKPGNKNANKVNTSISFYDKRLILQV